MKKILSLIIVAVLLCSTFSSAALAAEMDDLAESGKDTSGTTGDCTWYLDYYKCLWISGNGRMDDYSTKYLYFGYYITSAPWGNSIKKVFIRNGVTNIGEYSFYNCNLESVTIPVSVTSIGDHALDGCPNTTIIGYKNSFAEKYANENGFKFRVDSTPYLGDADGNGEVDMTDATVIQRVATMIAVPYDEEQLMCADIDDDGDLTIVDATFIQRYSTRIAVPYPIGEEIE